jgi:hypothetical protein
MGSGFGILFEIFWVEMESFKWAPRGWRWGVGSWNCIIPAQSAMTASYMVVSLLLATQWLDFEVAWNG